MIDWQVDHFFFSFCTIKLQIFPLQNKTFQDSNTIRNSHLYTITRIHIKK
nr:MAG TPA: hypothetical protein [Caudoviricetes sp.]